MEPSRSVPRPDPAPVTWRRLVREVSGAWAVRQLGHVGKLLAVARSVGPVAAARLVRGRHESAEGGVDCALDELSSFRGRLWVSGRIRSSDRAVVGLGIRLPHRRWGWIEAAPEPAGSAVAAPPAVSACPGGGASDGRGGDRWHRFSFSVPAPDGPASLAWGLRAALCDGTWVDLGEARHHALAGEAFSQLVPAFLARLSALPSGTVVEIGARARSGRTHRDMVPTGWTYLGFDIVEGPNVDVVGDAHEMSASFEPGSVDAVFSISTFEHLAMPWKVVLELNTIMKVGAVACIATHQTWPMHDEPWDFWRFSDSSWHALFNRATGFRVDRTATGQRADVVARVMNDATAGLPGQPAYLGSGVLVTKTGGTTLSWPVPTAVATRGVYPT